MTTTTDSEWAAAAEITAQLDRLPDPHRQKKRDTVLALVDARLAGRTEESVWKLPQTCSRTTYHTGWKFDPTFAEVLETCTKIARQLRDTRAARAIATAAERLALASPIAAARLIGLLGSTDENVVRLTAAAILDRAGVETATKGELVTVDTTLDEWRKDAEARRAAVDSMIEEFDQEPTA